MHLELIFMMIVISTLAHIIIPKASILFTIDIM